MFMWSIASISGDPGGMFDTDFYSGHRIEVLYRILRPFLM